MIVQHFVTAMLAEASITADVAARIYPQNAPDAPTYPYIVVSKIDGVGQYDMQGDAGIERGRVEVDIYHLEYAKCVDLKRRVRTFLTGRPPPFEPCEVDTVLCINDADSPAGLPNAATERSGPRIRRRLLEFTTWSRP